MVAIIISVQGLNPNRVILVRLFYCPECLPDCGLVRPQSGFSIYGKSSDCEIRKTKSQNGGFTEMKWNDGKERAKFNSEQQALREQYIAAGMTEEQIQEMYAFDLKVFNGKRREAEHTQTSDKLTVTMNFSDASRYSWIEEIEDEKLNAAIKNLSAEQIELLTEIVMSDKTASEIAREQHVSQQAISKRLKKIRNIFENRL